MLDAAASPDTSVTQIDDAELLTGKYKTYKRYFILAYTESDTRKMDIMGVEDRTTPRKNRAELIAMTRDICRQQGKPSGAVSVADIVSNGSILTFLKCD